MTVVIRLHGVSRSYPGLPPVEALRSIDLEVDRGEYVAVVGPSGSGKSTFLNVVGLLDRPSAGHYELDGIDVGGLTERHRTALRGQRIGFVFQAFHLMPLRCAAENVALAQLYSGVPRGRRMAAACAALQRVGLGHRVQAMANTLSGGEQQRVAIARAVVHRPSLLLCDEPTGNLDTATASEILALLDELHSAGMTLMVITHDPAVARRGGRTLTIRDGVLT
jgi:putative ABC transport system ATP-binding protein